MPAFDSVMASATRLFDSGNKDEALITAQNAYATTNNKTIADEINYFTFCNIYFDKKEDYSRSLSIADSLATLLEKNVTPAKAPENYIRAYYAKGDALMHLGLYNESYDYYDKAQKLAREYSDSCAQGSYSYILGMVLYKQHRYKPAATHFLNAFNVATTCKDDFANFYFRQEVLDNTGLCYYNAQQYDSALFYYNMALDFIKDNQDRFSHRDPKVYTSAEAVVYGNMAAIYAAQKNYPAAVVLYKRSIGANIQKGYANGDALIDQSKLAKIYYQESYIDSMKQVLQLIHTELDTIPDKQVQLAYNELMWHYYDRQKDAAKAYEYLLAYTAMNDTLSSGNKALMQMDIEGHVKSVGRQYEIELLNKDNEKKKIYLLVTMIVLLMAVIIIILILINDRKTAHNLKTLTALNNEINAQKAMLENVLQNLEQKDKDKSRILRSVAHDVMNPISAIIALTDILLDEENIYTEEQKEMLLLIKEACTNSLNLSRDILEAASEVDPSSIVKERTDIAKLVSNSVELLSLKAQAKQQTIIFSPPDIPVYASVNKDGIWRVLNNLITNAIKFSYSGAEIKVALSCDNEKVLISVADTGIGIPEKNHAHIFDMFTEHKIPGTAGETPHGMGLSISRQIAKAHNGKLWVESEQNKGSMFFFEFPI